jgi:ribosomal protein L13
MRKFILFIALMLSTVYLSAQKLFPVRIDKMWGLINADGNLVKQPDYQAIGEFKSFGYALMQKNGGVGLLDKNGNEIVPPEYRDLKVLDSLVIAVMDQGEWMVINLRGEIILNKGYTRLNLWDSKYLAFMKNGKWGIVDINGRQIAAAEYDEVSFEEGHFFLTVKSKQLGLLSDSGVEILPNIASEIKIENENLFFYREHNSWGAVDDSGNRIIEAKYDAWRSLSDQYIKLVADTKLSLYSIECNKIITQDNYDDFYPYSDEYVIVKQNRRLGLLDGCGNIVLTPQYSEIQAYDSGLFRVNFEGAWGVVREKDKILISFAYDYISPLNGNVCLVKKGDLFGLVNKAGKEIVAPRFKKIEISGKKAKAYLSDQRQDQLEVFAFDHHGELVSSEGFDNHFQVQVKGKQPDTEDKKKTYYQLDQFEWFYSPESDRWGLRKIVDGSIQIQPTFQHVQVESEIGFTLVGMWKYNKYDFERTTFRFEMVFGLVNNLEGLLVTEMDFLHINFEDFRSGYPVARFIGANGRHGLMDRIGRVVRRDFAYIGDFHEGRARMSILGQISGSMKPSRQLGRVNEYLHNIFAPSSMLDYTKYDQLFRQEAFLTCEDCEWGYIDTTGMVAITPQYTFARDFVNGTGMVECGEKWGMINQFGKKLINCHFDGIEYLENTDKQIVKVYLKAPKYGLIDTLGELKVSAVYDEIGTFAEDRLSVRRNGLWGYVNRDGIEVIPCRFKEVRDFNNGLAAVKIGRFWGFIDKDGDVQIDLKYKQVGNFSEGLSWVQDGEGVKFINPSGATVISGEFEKGYDFKFGVARVVVGGKYGLIDDIGQYILRPKYGEINDFNHHGLAVVRYGRDKIRYGVINARGIKITGNDYVKIEKYQEGLAVVKDKEGYGFIDTLGRLAIPCKYSKASGFHEGLAAVSQDGNCGYIRKNGTSGIRQSFTRCQDFDGGRAVVYKGIRKAGLIDREGAYVIKPSLDRLLKFNEGRGLVRDKKYRFYYITEHAGLHNGYYQKARAYQHGVAVVQINGKWGVINQKGMALIPPKYDKIEQFVGGYAKVMISGYSGLIDLEGKPIAKPSYELISYAGEGLFRAEQGDKVGYLDSEGNWIWKLTK